MRNRPYRRWPASIMGACLVAAGTVLLILFQYTAPVDGKVTTVQCSLDVFKEDMLNTMETYDMLYEQMRDPSADDAEVGQLKKRITLLEQTLSSYETQLHQALHALSGNLN